MDPTSSNYELQLLGQAGDDEDDMDAEREELFGSSVAPQDGGAGDGNPADAAGHAAPAAADFPLNCVFVCYELDEVEIC